MKLSHVIPHSLQIQTNGSSRNDDNNNNDTRAKRENKMKIDLNFMQISFHCQNIIPISRSLALILARLLIGINAKQKSAELKICI
jgi:hypothetical protein